MSGDNNILWKSISVAPQYEVSEFGEVRRRIAGKGSPVGKVIKQTKHVFGYPQVKLTINGKHKRFETHTVVALAFIGPKPFPKAEVSHKDGIASNIHYKNLIWESHKENESRKKGHGTLPTGSRNGTAKLNEEKIIEIRKIPLSVSHTKVASQFDVAFQTISKIRNNKHWRHVS